jgi:uncharacterized membrane protein YphA (DoxX/SURF4 family)
MPRYTVKTIFFLILLRLAIGWHFFIEGRHKFETWMKGNAEDNRPFSSAGYFRESNGPMVPFIHSDLFLGDPDEDALLLLTPRPLPADTDPRSVSPSKRVPAAMAKAWDDYLAKFSKHFGLEEGEQKDAENRVNQAKYQLGLWLTTDANGLNLPDGKLIDLSDAKQTALSILGNVPVSGIKEETKKVQNQTYDVKRTTTQRLRDYKDKLRELQTLREQKPWAMNSPVDKAALARVKAEVNAERQDLLDDLNKHTAALEESLRVILRNRAEEALVRPSTKTDEDVLALLTPPAEGAPPALSRSWDAYTDKLGVVYKLSEATREKIGKQLAKSKQQTAAWLSTTDMEDRVKVYKEASDPAKREEMRTSLLADLDKRTDGMKTALNKIVSDAKADVVPQTDDASYWSKYLAERGLAPNTSKVKGTLWWIDFLTVWGITIIGGLLMVGLFTRTACVLGALFLTLTYLTFPPFPWVPPPPQNEGNYLYVNKNLIELLALLVLATTASGRWLGLDAWIHGLFGRRDKPKTDDKVKKPPTNGSAPKPAPAPAPVVTHGRSPATQPAKR